MWIAFAALLAAMLAGSLVTLVAESPDRPGPSPWERLLLGIPLGLAAWAGLTLVLWSHLGPSNSASLLGLGLLLVPGVGLLVREFRRLAGAAERPPTARQIACWTVLPALLVAGLVLTRVGDRPEGLFFQGDGRIDLHLHMGFAMRMAEARTFPVDHPMMGGLPLRYHLFSDLAAAAALRLGFGPDGNFSLSELIAVLNFMDVALALSLVGLVGLLAFRHGLSPGASHLAVWLFLIGGGLGFMQHWPDLVLHPLQTLLDLQNPADRVEEWEILWTGLVRDFVLHARATLLGLTLGLAALVRYTASRPLQRADAAWAGVCLGLMPLSSFHAFLGTGLLLGGLWLLGPRRGSLPFWGAALPLLALQAPYLLSMRQGFVFIHYGWVSSRLDPWGLIRFWGLNLGAIFVLAALGLVLLRGDLRRLGLASLLAFAVPNVVVLTTGWTNIKVLHLWFLPCCILAAAMVEGLWRRGSGPARVLAVLLVILSLESGVLSVAFHVRNFVQLPPVETELARQARQILPRDCTTATFPDVNWTLPCFAGRPVYLGQSALSQGHGIEPEHRLEDLRALYGSPALAEFLARARAMKVSFIELQDVDPGFPVNRPLIEGLPLVLQVEGYRLYRIPEP